MQIVANGLFDEKPPLTGVPGFQVELAM